MHDLTIIKLSTGCYIESRDVAEVIGKRHNDLLRDIRGYINIMENNGERKIAHSDFFLESCYLSTQNKEMPCYLVSKMGAEMIASKLTGEKGILFTALYVARFNEMAAAVSESPKPLQTPRLGEYNAAARIVVRALHNIGAPGEQIVGFLKSLYEPLGFAVSHIAPETVHYTDDETIKIPLWYTAKDIAEINGVYSLTGHPHTQAVAAILSEKLFIGGNHKSNMTPGCGNCFGVSVRYDDYALQAVEDWILENGCPREIYGNGRTYHVVYDFQI